MDGKELSYEELRADAEMVVHGTDLDKMPEWCLAARRVARRVLDLLPSADDGESMTPEYIRQQLPPKNPDDYAARHEGMFGYVRWLDVRDSADDHSQFSMSINGETFRWDIASKGAFRRLMRAFGIPLSTEGR